MAAHSSPRGLTPAAAKASGDTRFSAFPKPSRPRALASRLAGSTVTTSTLPPCLTATMAAAAAAIVVLPTPPEPDEMAISLAASSCSSEPARGDMAAPRRPGTSVTQLGAQGLAQLAGGAQAVGAGEEVREVQHGDGGVNTGPQALEVPGSRAAHGHPPAGRGHDRSGVATGGLAHRIHAVGLRQRLEDLLLSPAEELGQHAVDDDCGQ